MQLTMSHAKISCIGHGKTFVLAMVKLNHGTAHENFVRPPGYADMIRASSSSSS
jgi:hypothetical protein